MTVDRADWENAKVNVTRELDAATIGKEINKVVLQFIEEKIASMPEPKFPPTEEVNCDDNDKDKPVGVG